MKMKNLVIGGVIIALLAVGFFFFNGDRLNRISRMEVTYLNGDYTVTYSPMSGKEKIYNITNDKVTTEPGKGYYFFWADRESGKGKRYVQVPTMFSSVEEK